MRVLSRGVAILGWSIDDSSRIVIGGMHGLFAVSCGQDWSFLSRPIRVSSKSTLQSSGIIIKHASVF